MSFGTIIILVRHFIQANTINHFVWNRKQIYQIRSIDLVRSGWWAQIRHDKKIHALVISAKKEWLWIISRSHLKIHQKTNGNILKWTLGPLPGGSLHLTKICHSSNPWSIISCEIHQILPNLSNCVHSLSHKT